MKIFCLISLLGSFVIPAVAERVLLTEPIDSNAEQSFSQLADYHNIPEKAQKLNAADRAFKALLRAMTPAIKNLSNYTGIFSGNCSVFFGKSIESAACDIDPAEARTLQPKAKFLPKKNLPREYWHQITSSHILLGTVFADWAKGMVQEYSTDLHFRQGTYNDTTSETTTPALPTLVPLTPSAGLLAAWSQTGGAYADSTSQVSRYVVSPAGVVNDALTGIQWEQAASGIPMTWSAASSYCSRQTTGGLTGWRLPNIGELQTLVDYTVDYTMAVPMNTGAFPTPPVADLWASTSKVGASGNSWNVYFSSTGYSYYATTGTTKKVRCIRSSYSPPPTSRYTVASGEVTDTVTGLIWQQKSPTTGGPKSNGRYTQSGAVGYCSGLTLNANSDWRLPTIKELSTLIDYSVSQGSLMMGSAFTGEPANYYWSSTALAGSPTDTWYAHFLYGELSYSDVSDNLYVRCVRLSRFRLDVDILPFGRAPGGANGTSDM